MSIPSNGGLRLPFSARRLAFDPIPRQHALGLFNNRAAEIIRGIQHPPLSTIFSPPFSHPSQLLLWSSHSEPTLPDYENIYSDPITHTNPGLIVHFNNAVANLAESKEILSLLEQSDPEIMEEVPIYALYLMVKKNDFDCFPYSVNKESLSSTDEIPENTFLDALKSHVLTGEINNDQYRSARIELYNLVSQIRQEIQKALRFSISIASKILNLKSECTRILKMAPGNDRKQDLNQALREAMNLGILNPTYSFTRPPFDSDISLENKAKLIPWLVCRCNYTIALNITPMMDSETLRSSLLEAFVQLSGVCHFFPSQENKGVRVLSRFLNQIETRFSELFSQNDVTALALHLTQKKLVDGLKVLLDSPVYRGKLSPNGWNLLIKKAIDVGSVASLAYIITLSPPDLTADGLIHPLNELIGSFGRRNPKFQDCEERLLFEVLCKYNLPSRGIKEINPLQIVNRCIQKKLGEELELFIETFQLRDKITEDQWIKAAQESAENLGYTVFDVITNQIEEPNIELFKTVVELLEKKEIDPEDEFLKTQAIWSILYDLKIALDNRLLRSDWNDAISFSLKNKCQILDGLASVFPFHEDTKWVNDTFLDLLNSQNYPGLYNFSRNYYDEIDLPTMNRFFQYTADHSSFDSIDRSNLNNDLFNTIISLTNNSHLKDLNNYRAILIECGKFNSLAPFIYLFNECEEEEKVRLLSDPQIGNFSPNSLGTLLNYIISSVPDRSMIYKILYLPKLRQIHRSQIETILETIQTGNPSDEIFEVLSQMLLWDSFDLVDVKAIVLLINRISSIRSPRVQALLNQFILRLCRREISPHLLWQLFTQALSKGFDTTEIQSRLNYPQVQLEWVQKSLNILAKHGNMPAIRSLCNLCCPHLPSINWDESIDCARECKMYLVVRQLEHYRNLVQNGQHANPNGIRAIRFN